MSFASISASVSPDKLSAWQHQHRRRAAAATGNGFTAIAAAAAPSSLAALPKSSSVSSFSEAFGDIPLPKPSTPTEFSRRRLHHVMSGQTVSQVRLHDRLARLEGFTDSHKRRPQSPPKVALAKYEIAAEREAAERERQLTAALRAREDARKAAAAEAAPPTMGGTCRRPRRRRRRCPARPRRSATRYGT